MQRSLGALKCILSSELLAEVTDISCLDHFLFSFNPTISFFTQFHILHCRRSGDKQQEGGGVTLQPSAVPSQVSDKQERAVIPSSDWLSLCVPD